MPQYEPQWPNPLELQDLKDAIIANQDTVVLSDREFTITYKEHHFFLSPVQGFAPCGWFEYDKAFAEIT